MPVIITVNMELSILNAIDSGTEISRLLITRNSHVSSCLKRKVVDISGIAERIQVIQMVLLYSFQRQRDMTNYELS